GYSVATYRNHTLRKTVLRNVLHKRLQTTANGCWRLLISFATKAYQSNSLRCGAPFRLMRCAIDQVQAVSRPPWEMLPCRFGWRPSAHVQSTIGPPNAPVQPRFPIMRVCIDGAVKIDLKLLRLAVEDDPDDILVDAILHEHVDLPLGA
ncbi:hypothetical protein Q2941_46490, partial [Bradyrhizobium sp. UFLA05-153]